MKDEFMEYGNRTPRPTVKGFLTHLAVWGTAAVIFIVGMIINGSVAL